MPIDESDKISDHIWLLMLNEFCYDQGSLVDISLAKLSGDWQIIPSWIPNDSTGVRANYNNVPMLVFGVQIFFY